MYKDIITDLKIPGIYILLNSKNEDLYNMVFEDVINLITWKGKKEINIKTIVTDSEKALMNLIKKYFPKSQRVACYFHYKQDIVRNIRSYGLYKDEMKKQSNEVIKILSSIPYNYKGNIEIVNKILEDTKKLYKYHSNFIENYFKINKMPYFIDNSLNYDIIPDDCRTNNFLENYNGYIKHILGKQRIINWVNFIHFIKSESGRSIEKLMNSNNNNLKIFKMLIEKEKILKKEKNKFKQEIIKPTVEINDNNEKKLEKSKKLEDKLDNVKKNELKDEIKNDNLIGIINIGNSFYINSIIQTLIHSPIFIDEFLNNRDDIRKMPISTSYNFLHIYDNIINAKDYKIKEIDISSFIYFLA